MSTVNDGDRAGNSETNGVIDYKEEVYVFSHEMPDL